MRMIQHSPPESAVFAVKDRWISLISKYPHFSETSALRGESPIHFHFFPPNSKKMANIFKTNTSGVTSRDINTTGLYEGHASLMFVSMEPGGLKLEGIQWLAVGSCDSQKKTKQPFSWEGMWTHKQFCSLSDYPCKKSLFFHSFLMIFGSLPSAKPFLRHFPGKCWWPHRTNWIKCHIKSIVRIVHIYDLIISHRVNTTYIYIWYIYIY